jgi:hypothetical protein
MSDDTLRRVASSFSNMTRLRTLEISTNLLTTHALELLASSVFKENVHLQNVILRENMIGEGPHVKDALSAFFESFLLDLKSPQILDLSYNRLNDESLYPVVKYLFANTECKIHKLNIEHNQFSNYAKRTMAQA